MKKIFILLTALFLLAGCTNQATSPLPEPMVGGGTYENYTEERYLELKGQKSFALFFHAKWCGECKSIEKNLMKNLSSYPEGVVILKADYDTETELKKEFDVKVQTTFVIFDAKGNVTMNKPIFNAEDVIAEIISTL
jgi:thioredoxin 1